MSISRVLLKLSNTARKRPLLFNSVIYGTYFTAAEFARQTYNKMTNLSPSVSTLTNERSDPKRTDSQFLYRVQKFGETLGLHDKITPLPGDYNWAQIKRYAIYGCLLAGPLLHGWYKWLDTFYKGTSMRTVLTKLFADQFILTPPLLVLFFLSMSLMEGRSDLFGECSTKFLKAFQSSCMFWIPVQFINFLLVPPSLRVLYVSTAAFCWINVLCYLKSTPLAGRSS